MLALFGSGPPSSGTVPGSRSLFSPGPFRFIHGGGKFIQRHLCLLGGGAGREDSSRGDHFYHFGTCDDLLTDYLADLFDPFDFLGNDPSQMPSNHADSQACPDDSRSGSEPGIDRFFQRKNQMVARADIPNGRHACL